MKYEIGDLIHQTNLKNIQSYYLIVGIKQEQLIIGYPMYSYVLLDPATGNIEDALSYYIEDNNWEIINAEGL